MADVPQWLGLLGVHQDLLWFLVLLAWSFAHLGWRRNPERNLAWGWLPWAALACGICTLLQFLVFNPPFSLFYERLVPGTNDTYTPALINPDFFADLALAGAFTAMAVIWWWRRAGDLGAQGLRWLAGLLGAGLFVLHWRNPALTGALLALLPFGALVYFWPRTAGHSWSRAALLVAVLLPALSTIGPVADWVDKLQRDGPTGWFGAVSALAQLSCGLLALTGLWREESRRLSRADHRALWHDARPFVLGGLAWLVLGTYFALRTGYDNAWEVKINRLRTAASRAAVFNLDLVRPLAGLDLHLNDRPRQTLGDGTLIVEVDASARDLIAPLQHELGVVVSSTPFLEQARFTLLRDGWLVAVADNRPAGPPGTVHLLRRATARDQADWDNGRDVIEELPVPEERRPYYCRAAMLGPDQTMLGWLDYVRAEFYSSMDRKWRTGPLLVTALGAILAAAFFVQRRSSREREAALRAAAVAEETGRIKTAFLAKVSHELRTPLQSILGYSEILQRELTSPQAVKQLTALRHHGQLMTRLVNDLIDLSALESGVFRLVNKPTPLAELVQQTVDSLRPKAEAKGLQLVLKIDPQLPEWIEADAERLRQIVLNLLGNAVKFTPTGRVEVGLHRPAAAADRFELTVRDTGPGIPAEDQPKLFEPFFRLELTAQQEGTGLGLALVAGLCRSMGGGVEVESALGAGACFRVRLPLRPAVAAVNQSRAQLDQLLRGQKVLVADDNALVRELFTTYLRSLGAECIEAFDGEEALDLVHRHPCNALVLDLAMPRLDGCSVARRLRAEGATLRIVGVSAHTDAADRAEALAAGMDAFLTKPIELTVLGQALATNHLAVPVARSQEQLQAQFAGRFRAELPTEIARITSAHAAHDWDGLRAAVHHLKNSALVVGDDRLSEACTIMERHIAARDTAAVEAAWSACTADLDRWTKYTADGGEV